VEGIGMEPTNVQWSLGYTLNTGNFQSLRIDCQVADYVRDGESTKEASDRVYTFVEQELVNKLNEAKKELG
jgi:methyl coenzyme M reductase subunit D